MWDDRLRVILRTSSNPRTGHKKKILAHSHRPSRYTIFTLGLLVENVLQYCSIAEKIEKFENSKRFAGKVSRLIRPVR